MAGFFIRTLEYLQTATVSSLVREGRVELMQQGTSERIVWTIEAAGSQYEGELRALVQFASGLRVRSSGGEPVELSFIASERVMTWPTVYPHGLDICWPTPEELLVLDVGGNVPGLVFYVSHDPASHAIAFRSLDECVANLVENHDWMQFLRKRVSERMEWPRVGDVHAEDDALREFFREFPRHYWVHDLCHLTTSETITGFPYIGRDDDIVRFTNLHLWVQKTPRGLVDRLKWFNRTGEFGP